MLNYNVNATLCCTLGYKVDGMLPVANDLHVCWQVNVALFVDPSKQSYPPDLSVTFVY